MKHLVILIVAAALMPAFFACNRTRTESVEEYQNNTIQEDKAVMDQLGDSGSAAIAIPDTGTDANGDSIVTVVDMTNVQ